MNGHASPWINIAILVLLGSGALVGCQSDDEEKTPTTASSTSELERLRHQAAYGTPYERNSAVVKIGKTGDGSRENFEVCLADLRAGCVMPPLTPPPPELCVFNDWVNRNAGSFGYLAKDAESYDEHRSYLAKACLGTLKTGPSQMSMADHARPSILLSYPAGVGPAAGNADWEIGHGETFECVQGSVRLSVAQITLPELCKAISQTTGKEIRWYPREPAFGRDPQMPFSWRDRFDPPLSGDTLSVGDALTVVAMMSQAMYSAEKPPEEWTGSDDPPDIVILIAKKYILIIAMPGGASR